MFAGFGKSSGDLDSRSVRRTLRAAILKYSSPAFASLLLVHALVTGPLLVECIPANGEFLVELLGHDPCHHPRQQIQNSSAEDSNSPAVIASDGDADPCVDLLLDSPGIAQTGIDLLSLPASVVTDELAAVALSDFGVICIAEVFKPAREPVISHLPEFHFDYTLRI